MIDIASRTILGQNQQTYQRLKVSLSLNLRRQIFIAVCDDLPLRNRLAAQLQTELTRSKLLPQVPVSDGPVSATVELQQYPRLVGLTIDLSDPNPIGQVAQWLRQFPPRGGRRRVMPAFQLLGVEQLTRQSAAIQRLFFNHLQGIERQLPLLESSLLIWITQPWFRALPQSAPEFWRCRTGVFEFIGDPTPLSVSQGGQDPQSAMTSRSGTATPSKPISGKLPLQPLIKPVVRIAADFGTGGLDTVARKPPSAHPSTTSKPPDQPPPIEPPPPLQPPLVPSNPAPHQEQPAQPSQETAAEASLPANSLSAHVSDEELQLLPLMERIEVLRQKKASPAVLADAYRTLGNLYRDRIEQGDTSPQNLTTAIQAYEQVLPLLPDASLLWVDVLNDMGSLYWMLSRSTFSVDMALPYLQKGIQAYQLALTKITPEAHATTYPLLQNNLGAAYADMARYQDPVQNLQQSVTAYQEALQYRTADTDPLRYASTQNNLGTTYWNLAQHQEMDQNLQRAIAAYSEALHHYDPQEEPLNYAMIQNNLGTAYWNLAQRDRPEEWLRLAIAAYQSALQYRTLDVAPASFAATQNNLGTAYWHLAGQADQPENRRDYLDQAIAAYNATLQAAHYLASHQPGDQPPSLSFDLFATHNNAGLAHYQLATDAEAELDSSSQTQHLEASLQHHILAIAGWEQKPDLKQTALTCIVQTTRAFYSQLGMSGQNLALSKIPGQLLPEILSKL